jgi:hypothetical protein
MKRYSIAALVFTLGILCVPSAMAGTVTVVNKTTKAYCQATFNAYFAGISTLYSTPCAAPGRTEWLNTWLSTGTIQVICYAHSNCNANGDWYSVLDRKEYTIPGTWLPHRNFTTTVTSQGREVNLWKGPTIIYSYTFTFEEK